jgi:excisionase family DNA binding protein
MAWTTREAAKYLGMNPTYVGILCNKGKLKATKHGRDWDIDPESVAAYKLAPKNKGGRPRKQIESTK